MADAASSQFTSSTPMESRGVALEGVSRRFRGAASAAVDEVSLHVPAGNTLCIVGPSGCGKSTTLRVVAGLEVPDAGRVMLDGSDITRLPPDQRDVAMVFQGFALYPHMRVRDILAFPLKMRKVSAEERQREVSRVAEFLNITALLDRYPGQLSGGEKQRVAMGRAIVRSPKIFLFDEPLSNLDAALRTSLRGELKRLLAKLGKTSIYVTHDQAEAMTLADEIAVMRQGRIEQIASPKQIYERPATAFVGRFFGNPGMNLLRLAAEPARALASAASARLPDGNRDEFLIGIRPEHLDVAPVDAQSTAAPGLDAKLVNLEPMGSETLLHLDAVSTDGAAGSGRAENARGELVARVHGWRSLSIDAAVRVKFAANALHFFDPKSEGRLA